jgi:4-hydroxybenzoate polyprenyltransferase
MIASSILMALFINAATVALFVLFLLLGLSYSIPRTNVKKRFPLKAVVPSSGAAVISLAGGVAAQGLSPVIFFAAFSFALFALVTLLIGDIADLKGDAKTGVRSFPLVVGPKNSVWTVIMIPLIISALGVVLFQFARLNIVFPIILIGLAVYCSITMRPLLSGYDNPTVCRKVKTRMRVVHFLLQLTFIIGVLAL